MEKQLSCFAQGLSQNSSRKILKVFIDGASRGNPGKSGAGIYIEYGGKELLSKWIFLGKRTNNQAEYLALSLGCFFMRQELQEIDPDKIIIVSDSELLIKQMKGEYKVKDATLKILKEIALNLIEKTSCHFQHVLRSNNKKADRLANIAIDKNGTMPPEFMQILHDKDLNNL